MITTKLDPISMNDVTDIENAPFVIEGQGINALKTRRHLRVDGSNETDRLAAVAGNRHKAHA